MAREGGFPGHLTCFLGWLAGSYWVLIWLSPANPGTFSPAFAYLNAPVSRLAAVINLGPAIAPAGDSCAG